MRLCIPFRATFAGLAVAATLAAHAVESHDSGYSAEGPGSSHATPVRISSSTDGIRQPASAHAATQTINRARPAVGEHQADSSRPRLALQSPPDRTTGEGNATKDKNTWLRFQTGTPLSTMLIALSIVTGMFLLLAWAVRRRMPGSTARLPDEIIEVLGRKTLAAKQSLHLVRIGGKLIVVSVTTAGCETLTEVTDPNEVTRILSACQRGQAHSSSATFRQLFEEFGREPAAGFLDKGSGRPEALGVASKAA